jgi:signal transduction histidine kinase/CheY-like chemotaxis protein/HPt (histidine-containing phosphotransfer) domain-containing protein
MEFQFEFSEMRRVFKSLETAQDLRTRRVYENKISASFRQIREISSLYIDSVAADQNKTALMDDSFFYVSALYDVLTENFFIGGNDNFSTVEIYNYESFVDDNLQKLRHLNNDAPAKILAEIEKSQRRFLIFTIVFLIAGAGSVLFMRKPKKPDENNGFKFIFESMPMVLIVWNSDYEIIECNGQVLNYFGVAERDDFIKNHTDFMPKFQPCGTPSSEKIRELLQNANSNTRFGFMYQNAKGESFPTETIFFPTVYNDKSVILECVFDISVIHDSMKKEREAIERTTLMFNAAPLVIIYWNEKHECIDCNGAAAAFYNIQKADELNTKFHQREIETQPDGLPSREYWQYQLYKAFKEGYAKFEYSVKKGRMNDDVVIFEITAQRMKSMDEYVVVTYATDVSELKAMVKERERIAHAEANSQAKSRFLARMSHEIRTPITAVIGIAEISLRSYKLAPEVQESFHKIYNASTSLVGIINDILDLSKIEAEMMELVYEKYSVIHLISDMVEMNVLAADKKIEFIVEIDENIPRFLTGDIIRVKQVLVNVLSNAFKYTDYGTVNFSMHCEPVAGEFNLVVKIQDTGRGMSEDQLEKLFEEYTRFHDFENIFVEGTGLGMPIVYNLLQLMSATIDIKSKIYVGTTITLKIPQKPAGTEIIGHETARRLEMLQMGRVKKENFKPEPMPYGSVLIVDDVETNRFVASGLLKIYEIKTETVSSGQEAIEKIKSGKSYDIIFMDHMMPKLNGVRTTQILRDMGYTEPIVALTANALVGNAEKFLQKGFNDFVAKPIETARLDEVLRRFIKNRHKGKQIIVEQFNIPSEDDYELSDYYKTPEMQKTMRDDFLENCSDSFAGIKAALEEGDTESAEIIIHTVKSLARYMEQINLCKIADTAENALSDGGTISPADLDALGAEIEKVLTWIKTAVPPPIR